MTRIVSKRAEEAVLETRGGSSLIRMNSVMPDIPRLAEESQKTSTPPGITKGSPISEALQTH